MMKSDAETVEEYLSELDSELRTALSSIRQLVHTTVPEAEETMRYGMPTFEYRDHVLCAAAAQKHYMSLYVDVDLLAEHHDRLAGLSLGKSCIRFTALDSLPLDVVGEILEQTSHRLSSAYWRT
jgi:uncharacterized protein YdhG (YjbR/CyaY superfamily)